MRDDYKLKGATARIEFEVEADVADKIRAMEKHSGLTASELGNTARPQKAPDSVCTTTTRTGNALQELRSPRCFS